MEQYESNYGNEPIKIRKTHENKIREINSKTMGTKTHVRRTAIHPGQTKGILTPDICHMQRHLKKESHIMFAVVMIQTVCQINILDITKTE